MLFASVRSHSVAIARGQHGGGEVARARQREHDAGIDAHVFGQAFALLRQRAAALQCAVRR